MNGKNVLSVLRNKMSGACAMALMLFTLASGSVFAQTGTPVTIPSAATNVDWAGLATSVATTLMGAAIAAIGVALGIWVVMAGLRLFRKAG